MPQRTIPLVNDQYYHVFNRSINKEPIFTKSKDCQRAITALNYYSFSGSPIRLAYFLAQGPDKRFEIMNALKSKSKRLVDIICFCLIPNHFHLLLKQNTESGISKFLSLFQNSYTKYFNTKYSRHGHLFQGQFKAVRIEDDEQLLHASRYIHLNPYSSFAIKTITELETYQYSSLSEYLGKAREELCQKEIIMSHFANTAAYKKFVFDQADYQRRLEEIKHLLLE